MHTAVPTTLPMNIDITGVRGSGSAPLPPDKFLVLLRTLIWTQDYAGSRQAPPSLNPADVSMLRGFLAVVENILVQAGAQAPATTATAVVEKFDPTVPTKGTSTWLFVAVGLVVLYLAFNQRLR
jgi:hypothetical protein